MDYTTVPELQPNPTPTLFPSYPPPSVPTYFPPTYPTHYQSYPQNPNPSSSADPQSSLPLTNEVHASAALEPPLNPPGVDSYVPLVSNSVPVSHLVHEAQPNYAPYAHNAVVDSSSLVAASGYYYDPNAQNWAAREAVRQYGSDPVVYGAAMEGMVMKFGILIAEKEVELEIGMKSIVECDQMLYNHPLAFPMPSTGSEQLAVANPSATWWANATAQPQPQPQPHANGAWKKYPKKVKAKIVQSAYCEVCKVDCTSKDVLDQHKLGKKHKKNLEKLREALKPPPVPPPVSSNPVIGPQPQAEKGKSGGKSKNKSKRKAKETPEDLERKKKKVLEGGAAAEAVKICGVCNVICNSETVYSFHLAGQKHIAMLKKQASEHNIAG
ncbi:zinc finger RNA-binding protein-like [Senna tora]|uniref:Zinc finger RNA-binding protein-like n=1 Tax=Senna tora TaxID=362788 RepID=A0A834SGE1_9FABA|nr:zinc finger RNA-binding protein-like [Senna tora]